MTLFRTAAIVALLGLSACTSISKVPAGPVTLAKGQTVMLQTDWADVTSLLPQRQKAVRVLSIDGPQLNRLYLIQGLRPGEGMLRKRAKEKPVPVFRSDLSPNELVEFISDSLAAVGYLRVASANLRPGRFGSTNALRFDLSAVTPSGLDISGTAQIAVQNGRAYGVVFVAPSEHYFLASLPQVDAMLGPSAATARGAPRVDAAGYQQAYEARVQSSARAEPAIPAGPSAPPGPRSSPPQTKTAAPSVPPQTLPRRCGAIRQPNGVVRLVPCS